MMCGGRKDGHMKRIIFGSLTGLLVCVACLQLMVLIRLHTVHRTGRNQQYPRLARLHVSTQHSMAQKGNTDNISFLAEIVSCVGSASPFVYLGGARITARITRIRSQSPAGLPSPHIDEPNKTASVLGIWTRQWARVEAQGTKCGLTFALYQEQPNTPIEWATLFSSQREKQQFVHLIFLHRRHEYVWLQVATIDNFPQVLRRLNIYIPTIATRYMTNPQSKASGFVLLPPAFGTEYSTDQFLPSTTNVADGKRNVTAMTFLPCQVKRVPDTNPFTTRVLDVLRAAKQALSSVQLRWWLNSGTLLGWLRECSVLVHSRDVDIGVYAEETNEDIIRDLIAALSLGGLRLSHRFGILSDSFELSFEKRFADGSAVKLDVFFFYRIPKTSSVWNGGTQARTGQRFKYVFPQQVTICWADLIDLRVPVPCEAEQHVEANYGPSWRVPVTTWDWKSSPPNVVPNGRWGKLQWPSTIQCDVCVHKVNMKTPFSVQITPENLRFEP